MPTVSPEQLISGAKSGKLVSFPTDTVPALAAQPQASALIFAVKKRSLKKPLILMGATWEDFLPYLQGTAREREIWHEVASEYLPGQLTLILPASEQVPREMNPEEPTTIGVRIPKLKIAQEILAETQPLATTSANRSGEPPLEKMSAIAASFPEVLTLDYEQTETASGIPSTVAKWTGKGWEILRQGSVKLER
ncbi:MAG: L-threonylcarbamoyladenylate synthase [Oscillatoria sp. PMC 1068.18]|nr:L-threonylcarbamoyladenylate synthase [Oscillatoria sp. PMC 1076.18]MEC4991363.1 L-threonylcarbamoyladenylate synthase [Oscillatoria sp. PMC 1068.18]